MHAAAKDFLVPGLSTLLHSSGRSDSSPLIFGAVRMDLTVPAPDFSRSGSAPSLQHSAHMGLMTSAYGLTCLGLLPPALDPVHLELLVLLQGFFQPESLLFVYGMSQLGSILLALDFLHPEFPLSLHSYSKSGSRLLVSGRGAMGLLLFATDSLHPGPGPLMRSFAQPGWIVPVLDFLNLEPFMPLRSYNRLDSTSSTFDYLQTGFSLLSRKLACVGLALFSSGWSWLELLLALMDPACPGLSAAARSPV
eukprot:s2095_g18.t1